MDTIDESVVSSFAGETTTETNNNENRPRARDLRHRNESVPRPVPTPQIPPSSATSSSSSAHGERPFQHTLHVQVPASGDRSTFNMSLCVNISTSTAVHSALPPSLSTSSSTMNNGGSAVIVPIPPAPSSARKRKSSNHKKQQASNESSLEKQSIVESSVAVMATNGGGNGNGSGGNGNSSSRTKSPFEKLNTLKLLLDSGHLTPEEYHERKTQIINEMTGTSTISSSSGNASSSSPHRPRVLHSLLKTVVPHLPPDFARIHKERAEKLSLDVETLEWHSTLTRVKLDHVPFATGQLRNAYYLQEIGSTTTNVSESDPTYGLTGRLLVAKFSLRPAEPSSYLSDVEMQAVCAHYAQLYNEHNPPLKVYYARSWILKLKDRGDLVCSVEEYLSGAYVKYSNNNGYVGTETSTTEERERNTPHAFSHFSFVASDYRLMIVDIQGVADSYTDPQIHTADGRGFGAGNLGTYGMEKFLESHRCNAVCRWLGLKSVHQEYKPGGTAAPLYAMPFGGKIKKSTSRITEERNTFSRSVTVSEAFGGSTKSTSMEDDEEFGLSGGAAHRAVMTSSDKNDDHHGAILAVADGGKGRASSALAAMLRRRKHPPSGHPTASSGQHVVDGRVGGGASSGASPTLWRVLQRMACGCCLSES